MSTQRRQYLNVLRDTGEHDVGIKAVEFAAEHDNGQNFVS